MLSGWLLSLLAVAYLGCLFAIAFYGDRHALYTSHRRLRPYIYALALGVYCTSWTFFGAVGSAVRDGWAYLPIYLGPALVFLFALPFMERLVRDRPRAQGQFDRGLHRLSLRQEPGAGRAGDRDRH